MFVVEDSLKSALKEYFGFEKFKSTQEEIVKSVLDKNDTFVLMPTGGGKSLCYQLPALISEGTAIIISPLIALMKNQVDQIRSYSSRDDVAHFMNSSLNRSQIKKVKDDVVSRRTKMLYVAPETLTKQDNLEFFKGIDVSFVAVDEAHCISEWGHDFRPEYRKIRKMIEYIGKDIPVIALTATATPKVQGDILKNLQMVSPKVFMSSFNRPNLHYEVLPKGKKGAADKSIVQFVKNNAGKSGIIYVLSRKSADELARVLQVNDIKAAPYHAGLDSDVRAATQDQFLMEDIDVIVATIAFGMGIDKPDVRFVIHYNLPRSIENYYQETGRAGRDGLEGNCVLYYSYKDVYRLEKLMRERNAAERDMGAQLIDEMVSFSESPVCRRKFLLHYFGEHYPATNCGSCDNCNHPKEKVEGKEYVANVLGAISQTHEQHRILHIVDILTGRKTREVTEFQHDKLPVFASGNDRSEFFWFSIVRQCIIFDFIYKDIENYGLLKLTESGKKYVKAPVSIQVYDYEETREELGDDEDEGKSAVLDPVLLNMLRDLRRKVSKEKDVPPFVVFQDPSLEEMAVNYPITIDELSHIGGVSKGKALRYGQQFIKFIANYVEDNNIDRPADFVVKSIANKSVMKVYIIQNIDRKINLEDIARTKNLTLPDLLHELETIVNSGTRLNLDYYIDEIIDDYDREIIYDYFKSAESDSLEEAYQQLKEDDINMQDIQLMRIKFMSEMAN